jgi:lia operon protein LiaF
MNANGDRPRVLIGVILVAIGALWLLNNFGALPGFNVWNVLWGVFWLWLGAVVVGPRGRGVGAARLTLGLFLIIIGGVTLFNGVGLIEVSFGYLFSRFWPLILIGLGALILLESSRTRTGQPPASDVVTHDSIFGDFKLTQPGWQLRDVRANTVIGDMKIDLSRATIPDGETSVDLRAVIGDIDVWAPPDLPVALEVQCVFVTVNHFGHKQDVMLRRYVQVPEGYDLSARRVRVRADMVFGDLNLIRAGQSA